ncbi:hypothetical protein PVNG_06353 [Plasmodium vivax North Korean]|uniref:VIR protein n=1 Tax=Plasmodium vivax North Korean TaxID=1035514 RepID=A0A0J9TL54_PLAVI|nr:hypothetical protein PVNG_06353 [Plasmodium vivax North Korean]
MYSYFEIGQTGCENFPFYTNIKEQLENYQNYDLPKISDKILKALCFIYNEKRNRNNDFNEDYCSYLYYWLGHKIYPLVHDKTTFSNIIKMIYSELYTSITENFIVCKLVQSPIDKDRFNNNKVLFDYSKDYHNIEIATAHGKTTCDRIYKNYIKKYIDIYKDAYTNCTGNSDKKYECEKYSEIWNEKLYNKLSTFSCILSENGRAVLERPRGSEEQETALAHHFPLPRVMDSASDQRTAVVPIISKHQSSRSLEDPGPFEALSTDDNSEGGTSKTIAGSVAPALGVSSISLLLYKVTPLGGFIRNFLGRNRNMYNPMEYMDSFNPYSDAMIPGDRTMNISYHRL